MKVLISLIVLLSATSTACFSQNRDEVDLLIQKIAGRSADIIHDKNALLITAHGPKVLSVLASLFADSTHTPVYSACHKRNLTKGEIAIILADYLKPMPYFMLIGLQNCMLDSCPDNPNFVEYYLDFIRSRRGVNVFKMKYVEWLKDETK